MILVQGYAIPWDKPAYVNGIEETCAPRAIAAETPRNIKLLYGDHQDEGRMVYAQTKDSSLRFFDDQYGLGFSAYLDDDMSAVRAVAKAIASGSITQCSVNMTQMSRRADGRIIWATIDHVSLVTQGAYEDTGCWIADQPVNQRPPSVRAMSRIFMDSVIQSSRGRQVPGRSVAGFSMPQPYQPGGHRLPAARSPVVPQSVLALFSEHSFAINKHNVDYNSNNKRLV